MFQSGSVLESFPREWGAQSHSPKFSTKKKKNLIYLLYTGCDFSCNFHVVLVKSLFIFFRVTKVKRINERVFG